MSNPFEGKFKAFAANLSAVNAQNHVQEVEKMSGEVFEDKPFSVEFQTLYRVANIGQTVSQIITYCTTAALAVFALCHIVPLWWGVYIAVPIALLFAFGVEKVKRGSLSIAAKHWFKYRQFGGVGFAAALVMCVSIAAALYGAKELPEVVYPKPGRVTDGKSVEALTNDLNRIQADIDRTAGKLAQGQNWVAENRTLPRLQRERAALMERRAQAQAEAEQRADKTKQEAEAERAALVSRMQVYSVGAAVVAEVVFLICTAFIFYYLFRHYAESTEQAAKPEAEAAKVRFSAVSNMRVNDNRLTESVGVKNIGQDLRRCEHCKEPYIYRHSKQKFCSDECRAASWESRTGAKLKHTKNVKQTINQA